MKPFFLVLLTLRFMFVQLLMLKAYVKRHFLVAALFVIVLGAAAFIFFDRFVPVVRPVVVGVYRTAAARDPAAGIIALGFVQSILYLLLIVPAAAQFSSNLQTSRSLRVVHCRLRRPGYISFLATAQLLISVFVVVDVLLWPLLWQKFIRLMSLNQFGALVLFKLFFAGSIALTSFLWSALALWLETKPARRPIKFALALLSLAAVSFISFQLAHGVFHIYDSVRHGLPYKLNGTLVAYRWLLLAFRDSSGLAWLLAAGVWTAALFGAIPLLNRSLKLADCIGTKTL